MRARAGFRVILDAEEWKRAVAHALVGVVVEVDVGDFDVGRRERIWIDAEAVIL
jgi:hypothetical protein